VSDQNKVDNTPDELDDIFDQKPGSRLVWIIPSILFHIVVIALWLLMPEKERVVEKRKVVINQHQAEQLQEFVKDANLVELQMEVTRLQEIKKQMDAIRLQEMNTLKVFTREMQTELEADVFVALNSIKNLQSKILIDQNTTLKSINILQNNYVLMANAVESSHYANMSVVASRIIEERKTMKSMQSPLLQSLKLLQANIDSADSTLSWLSVKSIQKTWGDIVDLQENILVKQVESIDKEMFISKDKISALGVLQKDAQNYEKRIYDFNKAETNKVEKYWKTLNYCTLSTNSAAKDLANSIDKKAEVAIKKSAAEKTMAAKKKISWKKSSTADEKKLQAVARKEYDAAKKQRDTFSHELKVLDGIISRNKSTLSSSRRTLSKLKFPSKGRLPYSVEQVKGAVAKLDGFPPAMMLQKEAIQDQEKAIKKLDALFKEIKSHLEANQ
jgi:hypothetical protein